MERANNIEKDKLHVVVVDDNQPILTSLEYQIQALGYRVASFEDSTEALSYIRGESVDVVLSDVKMPRLDGWQLLEEIQSCVPATAIILMTGHSDLYSTSQALEKGAIDFLIKPFDMDDLRLSLQRAEVLRRLQYSSNAVESLAAAPQGHPDHSDGIHHLNRQLFEEINARKQKEAELKQYALQQRCIAELAQNAFSSSDWKALLGEATWRITHILEVECCRIAEYHPDSGQLNVEAAVGWPPEVASCALEQALYALDHGFVCTADLEQEERFDTAALRARGMASGMSTVIPGGERAYGVLETHSDRRRHFTENEENYLQAIANLLATAFARKCAEERLQVSEANRRQLARAVEQSSCSVVITDTLGNIEYVNSTFVQITGYTAAEVVGANPRLLKSGKMSDAFYRDLWQTVKRGDSWHGEFLNRKKSGDLLWELASISPIRDEEGHITHFVAVKEDITEKRRIADALQLRVQQLEFLQRLHLIVQQQDVVDQIIEAVGKAVLNVISADEGAVHLSYDGKEYMYGSCNDSTMRHRVSLHWGGQERGYLGICSCASIDPSWRPILLDETAALLSRTLEARESRAALLHSARLVSLGEMAAGVAHELNQPLTAISVIAEGIEVRLEQGIALPEKRLTHMAQDILDQIRRMTYIIEHLRVFSRDHSTEAAAAVCLNEVVQNALALTGTQLKNCGVDLVLEQDPELPCILGDAYRMEQVVLNLITNARDALNEREEELAASQDGTWLKSLRIGTRRGEGGNVVIEVEDAGIGIKAQDRQRLFQPFFTTKEPDRGTGLGLSISYAIVRDHNGEIQCRSQVGVGTVFTVILPAMIVD